VRGAELGSDLNDSSDSVPIGDPMGAHGGFARSARLGWSSRLGRFPSVSCVRAVLWPRTSNRSWVWCAGSGSLWFRCHVGFDSVLPALEALEW